MAAAEKRFPQAQFVYVTSSADGYMAVRQGRIDAYAFDSVNATCACRELGGMEILPESFGRTEIAVGISKLRPDLAAPVNEALSRLRAAGTLEDLYRRWITIGDHAMPEIAAPEHPQITLRVGTSGLTEPMSFVGESGALIGYDVELTRLLAREMNAKIELKSMGFDALVSGLQSGKLDLVLSNLNITPERREIIDYSDPYLLSDSVLVIANGDGAYDLPFLRSYFGAGSRVGIGTGSVFDQIADEAFPQAQKVYFSTSTDMIEGMKTGKIDGFLTDRPQGACACAENDFLWMPEAVIKEDRYAFAVNKKQPALCDQISRTIERLQREGALTALAEKWMGADEAQKPMPEIAFTGENGPMTLMTEAGSYPFSYVRDGEIVGYDIEIFLRFCEEFGYTPDIETAAFDGVITAIATGKADLAACCISVTDERKENMLFSTPNFYGGVAAILPASAKASGDAVVPAQAQAETPSFFADVAASFERTFLRENRWKMIASGLWVTVLISVLSCLFGTLLGFVVCLARRSKYRALAVVARVYIRLVQGTPLVVLLMILYYLVFGDVEPILVAVVGFSVNFAAYVSEMMRTGIDAVDKGQIEAAAAIGFTRVQTFLRITLPQAARHFLPVFKGEFISLVKMTSVVGYITIEDLTKVSDIIRSRTYEAFFPLIATAVLYFLIAWVLTLALSAIEKGIDPKRKKRAVKGVHAV